MPIVRCGSCLQELYRGPAPPAASPCPACGSFAKEVLDDDVGRVFEADHLEMTHLRDGAPIAFDESPRADFTRYGSTTDDGAAVISLDGLPPRNEDNAKDVAQLLLDVLYPAGLGVSPLSPGSGDDDFTFSADETKTSIQVVRAMTDPTFWQRLFADKEIKRFRLTYPEASTALKAAIEHKIGFHTIPVAHRPSMILALDAYRLPGLALGPVVDEFRQRSHDWVSALHFKAVYLVGPNTRFVYRLDALAV